MTKNSNQSTHASLGSYGSAKNPINWLRYPLNWLGLIPRLISPMDLSVRGNFVKNCYKFLKWILFEFLIGELSHQVRASEANLGENEGAIGNWSVPGPSHSNPNRAIDDFLSFLESGRAEKELHSYSYLKIYPYMLFRSWGSEGNMWSSSWVCQYVFRNIGSLGFCDRLRKSAARWNGFLWIRW